MVYEFARLADVETLSSPQDNANVLIVENGEVRQVPKNEIGGAGFVVNANVESFSFQGEEREFTTDKTYEEVLAAIQANKNVSMKMQCGQVVFYFPLSSYSIADQVICFGGAVAFEIPGSNAFMTAYMAQDGRKNVWGVAPY